MTESWESRLAIFLGVVAFIVLPIFFGTTIHKTPVDQNRLPEKKWTVKVSHKQGWHKLVGNYIVLSFDDGENWYRKVDKEKGGQILLTHTDFYGKDFVEHIRKQGKK